MTIERRRQVQRVDPGMHIGRALSLHAWPTRTQVF
jgi:hypothetical protein